MAIGSEWLASMLREWDMFTTAVNLIANSVSSLTGAVRVGQ